MKRKRLVRPHWQTVTEIKPNNKQVIEQVGTEYSTFYGREKTIERKTVKSGNI